MHNVIEEKWKISIDFKKLFGSSTPEYGLTSNWDDYSKLVLEKVFIKTNNNKIDIVRMKNNEGKL